MRFLTMNASARCRFILCGGKKRPARDDQVEHDRADRSDGKSHAWPRAWKGRSAIVKAGASSADGCLVATREKASAIRLARSSRAIRDRATCDREILQASIGDLGEVHLG
jgi:hypothetical protein